MSVSQGQREPAAPSGRRWIEIAFQLALVAASAFFLWQGTLVNEPPTNLVVGPRTFPILVGGLMLAVSIVLLWRLLFRQGAMDGGTEADDAAVPLEEDETAVNDWSAVWIVLAATPAMIMLLEPLGFVVAIALYLFGLSTFFSPRRWLRNLVVALVFSTFFYALFAAILGIALPKGILAPFLTTMVG